MWGHQKLRKERKNVKALRGRRSTVLEVNKVIAPGKPKNPDLMIQ